jgi:hypothetical protein
VNKGILSIAEGSSFFRMLIWSSAAFFLSTGTVNDQYKGNNSHFGSSLFTASSQFGNIEC